MMEHVKKTTRLWTCAWTNHTLAWSAAECRNSASRIIFLCALGSEGLQLKKSEEASHQIQTEFWSQKEKFVCDILSESNCSHSFIRGSIWQKHHASKLLIQSLSLITVSYSITVWTVQFL
jgi:hypothetical protein